MNLLVQNAGSTAIDQGLRSPQNWGHTEGLKFDASRQWPRVENEVKSRIVTSQNSWPPVFTRLLSSTACCRPLGSIIMRRLQTAFPVVAKQLIRSFPPLPARTFSWQRRSATISSTRVLKSVQYKAFPLRFNPEYKQLFDHCYDATSPIGAGFSRDWENWQRIDFFKVRDSWMDVTEAELVLNKIYKLPKPIIPLAFLDAHDYHLLLEAGSEHYYLDGADGHLFQYETRFVDRDDFLENFLEKGHMKEIPWPEDAKAIGYETQWQ
ncbi:hypothetical protein DFH06DRAFT_1392743 [Mycena polygramma]|nr:hypothetical protein DFH06DRAFT_1392743 [Mycena polygramma]